jgi:hypothetical protein
VNRALASLAVAASMVAAGSARGQAATAGGVDRYAIVLGNSTPDSDDARALRYADDDAIAVHVLLREAGVTSILLTQLDADTARLHPELAPVFSYEVCAARAAATIRLEGIRSGLSRSSALAVGCGRQLAKHSASLAAGSLCADVTPAEPNERPLRHSADIRTGHARDVGAPAVRGRKVQ